MSLGKEIKSNTDILVVDDEPSIRHVVELTLTDENYNVSVAESGSQAVEILKDKSFDLIITDIMMPFFSGVDLLRHVKGHYPETDVIMMTGYASMENVIETMREGAVDYIIKPFDSDNLIFIVEQALQKRSFENTQALFEFSRKIFSTIEFDELLKVIIDTTVKTVKPDEVSLMLLNEDNELYIANSYTLSNEVMKSTTIPIGSGIAGKVAELKTPVILGGLDDAKKYGDFVPRSDISSAIIYPLIWNGNLLGVLNLSRTVTEEKFTRKHLLKLSIYGSLLCQALENSKLHFKTNTLVRELTSTKEELIIARDNLDKKVQERTKELSEAKNNLELYSHSLEQKTYELSTLYSLSLKIISVLETDQLVRTVNDIASNMFKHDLVALVFNYKGQQEIFLAPRQKLADEDKQQLEQRVVTQLTAKQAPKTDQEAFKVTWLMPESGDGVQTSKAPQDNTPITQLASRLYLLGDQAGFLNLFRFSDEAFSSQEKNLFSMVGTNVSLALGNAYSFQKLQETDKIRSEFVSTVSHELRTPLTCIGQSIKMMCDGTVGEINEVQLECLTIAREEVDRLGRLIKDMLDVSKMEAGKMDLNFEHVNIDNIVFKTASVLTSKLESKNMELEYEPSGLTAWADQDKIQQVLMNLMDNAIKFSPRQGTLQVKVHPQDSLVKIEVTDSGPGISEQNQNYLFEKFVQVLGNKNRPTGGSGLGLFICKSLIKLHKGKIWVESQLDKGSSFFFTLPRKELKDS